MDDRQRPLSTADLAGTPAAEPPPGATDTTAMPQMTSTEPEGGRAARSAGMSGSDTSGGAGQDAEGVVLTGTRAAAEPLLPEAQSGEFRTRWEAIQGSFVDEPRRAVEQADALVAEVMQRLAESFAHTRSALEAQWASGTDAGTEELRVALQRYRQFFETLLRR